MTNLVNFNFVFAFVMLSSAMYVNIVLDSKKQFNNYLLIAGMPGVSSSSCGGFFSCFYYECTYQNLTFTFDSSCGLSQDEFLTRARGDFNNTKFQLEVALMTTVGYLSLTTAVLMVSVIASVCKFRSNRWWVVVQCLLVMIGGLVANIAVISTQVRINELEPYLPNFVTDSNTVANITTIIIESLYFTLNVILIVACLVTLKDSKTSLYSPLAFEKREQVLVTASDVETESETVDIRYDDIGSDSVRPEQYNENDSDI